MTFAHKLRSLLTEMPWASPSPQKATTFTADYYAKTPKGTAGRFTRTTSLMNLRGAQSETAVKSYLQTLHPSCEITIQSLSFK